MKLTHFMLQNRLNIAGTLTQDWLLTLRTEKGASEPKRGCSGRLMVLIVVDKKCGSGMELAQKCSCKQHPSVAPALVLPLEFNSLCEELERSSCMQQAGFSKGFAESENSLKLSRRPIAPPPRPMQTFTVMMKSAARAASLGRLRQPLWGGTNIRQARQLFVAFSSGAALDGGACLFVFQACLHDPKPGKNWLQVPMLTCHRKHLLDVQCANSSCLHRHSDSQEGCGTQARC